MTELRLRDERGEFQPRARYAIAPLPLLRKSVVLDARLENSSHDC